MDNAIVMTRRRGGLLYTLRKQGNVSSIDTVVGCYCKCNSMAFCVFNCAHVLQCFAWCYRHLGTDWSSIISAMFCCHRTEHIYIAQEAIIEKRNMKTVLRWFVQQSCWL